MNNLYQNAPIRSRGFRPHHNGVQSPNSKVRLSLGCGLISGSYEGNEPCKDTFLFGVGAVGVFSLGYGVKKLIDYWWKPKKGGDDEGNQESLLVDVEMRVTPRVETLNQTCRKPLGDLEAMRLVGDLVFKGDTITLYSAAGEGKSTLAMGMCIDIAKGAMTKILPPDAGLTCAPQQTVLYYDAELTDEDIQMRYGQGCNVFPENLKRISTTFPSAEEMFKDIESRVANADTDVTICIDNLSAIIPPTSGKEARKLFLLQKAIKEKAHKNGKSVTFIVLTHTTKTPPGQVNETMAGSAQIGNLTATCIALHPTKYGNDFKALRVVKNRKFGKDGKVIVVKRVETPYSHFEYDRTVPFEVACPKNMPTKEEGTPVKAPAPVAPTAAPCSMGTEKMPAPNQKVTPEMQEKIEKMLAEGKKPKAIARTFRVSERTIRRIKKTVKDHEVMKG